MSQGVGRRAERAAGHDVARYAMTPVLLTLARWEKSVEGVAYAVRTYTKEVAVKEDADV